MQVHLLRSMLLPILVSILVCPSVLTIALPPDPHTATGASSAVHGGDTTQLQLPGVAPEALDVSPPTARHEQLRQRINRKQAQKVQQDPPEKYFHESSFHEHYDGRFAQTQVAYDVRRDTLVALIQSYLATMNEIGAETWIMHGSLLGWWWNKRIMPWDSDLDVMVSERTANHLAKYYNMTVHHHSHEGWETGRNYMLEVNPHYTNTSRADEYNKIDGRWIDMDTGLFIDITVLHEDLERQEHGFAEAMYSKDDHNYPRDYIFPLRESVFERTPCMIPYGYADLLVEEYGPAALTTRDFEHHHFDQEVMDWLPNPDPLRKPEHAPGYRPADPAVLPHVPADWEG